MVQKQILKDINGLYKFLVKQEQTKELQEAKEHLVKLENNLEIFFYEAKQKIIELEMILNV